MSKVAVGLSGGIDSGSTARLLLAQGYDVIGVTMWVFDHQTDEIKAAKKVADLLGIGHYVLDYRDAFHEHVVQYFNTQYALGFTPNPCIVCNQIFKYGRLIDDATLKFNANFFATGHYARSTQVVQDTALAKKGEYQILKAVNRRKDQSYNLFTLNQETISKLIFPLGQIESKDTVRAHFSDVNPSFSQKKDSLGICFIPDKDHLNHLKRIQSTAMTPGKFVGTDGSVLGEHSGIAHYTIGQKRRLGKDLNGQYLNGKYVVVSINSNTNTVVLGEEPDLMHHRVQCKAFNTISNFLREQLLNGHTLEVDVCLSQWSEQYRGVLSLTSSSGDAVVTFEKPVRAPSPGQALVCYSGEVLIGGGIIA